MIYNKILAFGIRIFRLPSSIIFIIGFISIMFYKHYKEGLDVFDREQMNNVLFEHGINYDKYSNHINWIFWILILLNITL
jgi:hypothetical protein